MQTNITFQDGQNISITIPNNVISQNPTTDTITVDVYEMYGKKLIEGIKPINLVNSLAPIPTKYRDP